MFFRTLFFLASQFPSLVWAVTKAFFGLAPVLLFFFSGPPPFPDFDRAACSGLPVFDLPTREVFQGASPLLLCSFH